MDTIIIQDLEVAYRVGVPDSERAVPQRLLICLELGVDLARAATSDRLEDTIDYYAVTRHLLAFGDGRSWRLIEKLAADIAESILGRFHPQSVVVEVRKFILPETRHVGVRVCRSRT